MSTKNTFFDNKVPLTEFRDILFEPVIDLAEILDYTGRPILITLPYLRKHELVPFFPKGKWQLKISFMQLIWLRVIDTLRQFSYKVADMQKLCDYFFKDAYHNELPKANIEYNIERLEKMKLAGTISIEELTTLKKLEHALKDPVVLYGLKLDISYLSNLVLQCIDDREDTGILVFTNGRVMEYDSKGFGNHNLDKIDVSEPHIHLSIKYFLKEFINDDELSTLLMPRLLNDNEQKVLKELNNRNVAELVIKKSDSGELRIDSISKGVITGEQAKEIRRILGLDNYEQLQLSTRDKKTLSFVRTKKKTNSD
jgi:hypothetical protein